MILCDRCGLLHAPGSSYCDWIQIMSAAANKKGTLKFKEQDVQVTVEWWIHLE